MKQNFIFCVFITVLTYIKDVFDGTSPILGDVLVFSKPYLS